MIPGSGLRAARGAICSLLGGKKTAVQPSTVALRRCDIKLRTFSHIQQAFKFNAMSYSSSTSQPQQRNHQLFQELHKLTASVVQTTKVDSKAAISLLSQVELGNYYEADALCDEIHDKVGWLPDLCNPIVAMYIRCYRRDKAEQLLRDYRKKNIFPSLDTYNKLFALSGAHKDESAIDSLFLMAQQDFPDKLEQIYAIAIHAYGRMKSFGKCEDLIEDMRDKNITPSNAIYTTLLEAYCRHNVVEKGLILFRQMKLDGLKPNHIMFNHMISACARLKNDSMALKLFRDMKEVYGLKADIVTWNALIDCYCRAGNLRDARKLMLEMEKQGINPDTRTYGPIVVELIRKKDIDHAEGLIKEMEYLGVEPDALIWNWLIEGFARNRQFERAMELVVKMRQAGMEPDRKLKHVLKSVATKSDKLEEYAATFGGYVSENTIVKDERWAAAEAAIPAPAAGAKGRRAKWPLMDSDVDKSELEERFNPKEWITIEDPLSQTKPETIQQRRALQASESKLRIMEREVEEKNRKWKEDQRALKEKKRAKRVEARQFTIIKEKDRKRKEKNAGTKKNKERKPQSKAKFQFRK